LVVELPALAGLHTKGRQAEENEWLEGWGLAHDVVSRSVKDLPSIEIVPLSPHYWVVREEGGRDFGHYTNPAQAEAIGRALARKRNWDLVIHPVASGIPIREKPKGWFRRWFGG
jgi:hypothetical protein